MTTFTTKNVNLRVNQPDGAIMARIKETLTLPAIPSRPLFGHFGIVFGGQFQSKLCVAIGSFRMGDELHLSALKKNVHSFNRYFNHPLRSFSSTQRYPPHKL